MYREAKMGFKEIPHSADWAMRVWAEDLAGLLAESARGLNALAGVQISPDVLAKRTLELDGADDESLLVSFLSELIYIQEQENLAFDRFSIQIIGRRLVAEMSGGRIV